MILRPTILKEWLLSVAVDQRPKVDTNLMSLLLGHLFSRHIPELLLPPPVSDFSSVLLPILIGFSTMEQVWPRLLQQVVPLLFARRWSRTERIHPPLRSSR